MRVGLEKIENHKGAAVKVLLDNRVTDLFMDTKFVKEKGFKLEKLKKISTSIKHRQYSKCGGSNYTLGKVQYVFQRTHRKSENKCIQLGKNGSDTGYTMASYS